MAATDNHFQFAKSQLNDEVILLNAAMNDFSYGTHAHEEFSFGITLSGRQDFFALGEHHKSHPGNVIVFNPDDAHDGHSGGDETLEYKMLYVHPDQLTPMLKSAGIPSAQHFRIKQCVQNNQPLRQQILHLSHLVEAKNTSAIQYTSALFDFAELLAQQQGIEKSKGPHRKDALFEQVRDYLHSQLTGDISLDELSKMVHLSKYHFLRCFRDYFGMTPHKYWQNYRLNQARKAIASGMPIADAMYHFGFSDLSYFNRCFKPSFGTTPSRYRNNLLAN